MFRYTRSQINDIATRKRFIANTPEKVLRLYDILEFIGGWQDRDLLVLKGGTAINLCILELPRLSVDIDFDFSVNCNR